MEVEEEEEVEEVEVEVQEVVEVVEVEEEHTRLHVYACVTVVYYGARACIILCGVELCTCTLHY